MRRGIVVIGVVSMVLVAGCGGGSPSVPPRLPQSLAAARIMVRKSVDSKLTEVGASRQQIGCVDRKVEAMTARQFAQRLVEARIVEPATKQTPRSVTGSIGKGCF